jgi:hypothetical protein
LFNESKMALLGVQEPARFKNCLTPPTLSETPVNDK